MEVTVKERLTGALILVAAAVIIVPEMLLGPKPRVVTAAVTPAQSAEDGAPLRTYSLTLDNAAAAATPAPPMEEPAAPVSLPAPAVPEVAAAPAEQAAPAAAAAKEPSPAPQPKPAAPAAPGKWWVNIGVYKSQENADRLARQLRAAGFAIDVSKVRQGGKDMYRVRAGPSHDRAEAVALQARVAATGNDARLAPP